MKTLACVALAFSATWTVVACGDDHGSSEEEPFDNLQDCYTDHTSGGESLKPTEAIVVCCLEHPIAGQKVVCKDSQAECEAFVGAELDDSVTAADITAGCTDYLTQKGM